MQTTLKRCLSDHTSFEDVINSNNAKLKKQKTQGSHLSCPVKGCAADVEFVKLSKHLIQHHNIFDKGKRTKILERCARYGYTHSTQTNTLRIYNTHTVHKQDCITYIDTLTY